MRKQGAARKFLAILLLAVFISVGHAKDSAAQMTPCPYAVCIEVLGFEAGFGQLVGDAAGTIPDAASAALDPVFMAALGTPFGVFPAVIGDKILGVIDDLTGTISSIWEDELDPAMQDMVKQLSTLNASQSVALAAFLDAANHYRVRQELRNEEVDSLREQHPGENVCVAGTIVGGITRAGSFQRAYNAAAPAEMAVRTGNTAGTVAGGGRAAAANVDFLQYVTRYCSAADNNGASGCADDGSFVGQDIDVTGTIFAKETIDVTNDDTRTTVDDLIRNIAEPLVKDPVSLGAVGSATGQQAILAGESYAAKRQTIYDGLYHIVSRRVPGSQMGAFVGPLRKAAGVHDTQISGNPSHNEIMQAMMNERFRNGNYAQQLIDEPENNQRELVVQQAFQLMQMSDQLDLMDRYSLLLAAQVGAEILQDKHPNSAIRGAPLR
ncbi:MAG: hypothetical protein HY052_07540 [Proteobacteria bacterium]|nr:hypothetical protein [Pseudomonadota bacterium]